MGKRSAPERIRAMSRRHDSEGAVLSLQGEPQHHEGRLHVPVDGSQPRLLPHVQRRAEKRNKQHELFQHENRTTLQTIRQRMPRPKRALSKKAPNRKCPPNTAQRQEKPGAMGITCCIAIRTHPKHHTSNHPIVAAASGRAEGSSYLKERLITLVKSSTQVSHGSSMGAHCGRCRVRLSVSATSQAAPKASRSETLVSSI